MNLVTANGRHIVSWAVCLSVFICAAGCSRDIVSANELVQFQASGPVQLAVDTDALIRARISTTSYKVVPGDLLSIRISPAVRSDVDAASVDQAGLARRVDKDGKILLPLVKELSVADKTILEVEAAIVEAYKNHLNDPSAVVQVAEFNTKYVEVVGAVGAPGVYQLRSDEMTLVSLLLKAGNVAATGAGVVRITSPGQSEAKTVELPVNGLNTPFADVPLKGGEVIQVERLNAQTITILGLAKAPGTYAYPADARINLISALGMAGGPDPMGDPRCACVYRQNKDGQIISARFQLNGNNSDWTNCSLFSDSTLGCDAFTAIKPGDVIFLEKDLRTRTRTFLIGIMRFTVGASATANTQATYYQDYSQAGGVRVR